MEILRTDGLKQIILLILITFIGILLTWQLKYFISGFLGAVTLYILFRHLFFNLTIKKRWKKWIAALFIILLCLVVFVLPIWALIELLLPKFFYAYDHSHEFIQQGQIILDWLKEYFPALQIDDAQLREGVQKMLSVIPTLLNATASIAVNILMAFFILYFMLLGGRDMEKKIMKLLPLREENKDSLWNETRNMVISNAVGIPILVICQCVVAVVGYWLFGVPQALFWGMLTGVASLIPMVGTMIVWIPVCIAVIAGGATGTGIGLALYCALIVANIDNVLRFTIMKKIGDVHPLITVFGVIAGLQVFGLMGLIFGPLLIAYFLLLIKIYRLEFSSRKEPYK